MHSKAKIDNAQSHCDDASYDFNDANVTRSSATAEGPRDALCQLKCC